MGRELTRGLVLMCGPPPAHTQRLVHIQSMLKRAPSYRTLELELLEWQERELFEYFVVVSLKKKPSRNTYLPEVSYQVPKVRPLPPSWPLPFRLAHPVPAIATHLTAPALSVAPWSQEKWWVWASEYSEDEGGESSPQCG